MVNFNRPKSPSVISTTEDAIKEKNGDVILVMISDIQCRDEKECKRLDKSFDSLAKFLSRYPDAYKIIYMGGDLVQSSLPKEVEDFKQKEARVAPFADEILKVCGNHDVKEGIDICRTLIHPRELWYKIETGNMVFILLSNWHEQAHQKSEFQRHIPEEGITFLLEEGKKALKENKILFIGMHEKPEGVGWASDPRVILKPFLGGKDRGSVYNSKQLKPVLRELGSIARNKKGIVLFGLVSHTHSPYNWPHTTFMWNDALYINTNAIRRTDTINDMQKINPFRKLLGLFGIHIEGNDPISYIFGKAIMAVVPWNKYSTARVMYFTCASDEALLFSRNLTKDEWFRFAYKIKLGVPFQCK